jgi:acyl-CoA thioester hydrolase
MPIGGQIVKLWSVDSGERLNSRPRSQPDSPLECWDISALFGGAMTRLNSLPTSEMTGTEIVEVGSRSASWFEYSVRVHPHHTDYAGMVWHGTYLTWMEEARVEALRMIGIEFADLVAMGCNLPVIDLSIRYHRAARMGQAIVVRARMGEMQGVRLHWDYEIRSMDESELYVTARVTLVAVDMAKGKIMRQLPPVMQDALSRL